MRSEGESELIELMYMIETDADMIVPVNIGEQTEESLQGRRRVALVKQLKDGGHVFLLKELLYYGVNILPNFLMNIERAEWVTFHKNQIRVDFNKNSKLISVFDVKLTRSNNKPDPISFWDAMAHQVINPYDINSWETVVSEFISNYIVAFNQQKELPAVPAERLRRTLRAWRRLVPTTRAWCSRRGSWARTRRRAGTPPACRTGPARPRAACAVCAATAPPGRVTPPARRRAPGPGPRRR